MVAPPGPEWLWRSSETNSRVAQDVRRRAHVQGSLGSTLRSRDPVSSLITRLLTVAAVIGGVSACRARDDRPATSSDRLTGADSAAIAALQNRYVAAWLADDTAAVLALFENDAMILPPGRQPVRGVDSIRAYWWPTDGSTTRILSFAWKPGDISGTDRLAFSHGQSELRWRYTKGGSTSESSSRSVNLSVFRRAPSGEWHIARQMWGPPLAP